MPTPLPAQLHRWDQWHNWRVALDLLVSFNGQPSSLTFDMVMVGQVWCKTQSFGCMCIACNFFCNQCLQRTEYLVMASFTEPDVLWHLFPPFEFIAPYAKVLCYLIDLGIGIYVYIFFVIN